MTSIGGADTWDLAWRRKKMLFLRHEKFCPQQKFFAPQKICELAPLLVSAVAAEEGDDEYDECLWYENDKI